MTLRIVIVSFVLLLDLLSCGQKTILTTDLAASSIEDNPESNTKSKHKAYYHFILSKYHLLKRKFSNTLQQLVIAEKYDPKSAYLKHQLALLYISAGRIKEAIDKLEQSVELDPKFAPSFTTLGKIYAVSHNAEYRRKSVEILKQATQINSDDPEAYLSLGIIQIESGKYSEAEENFRKVIEIRPDNERGYYFIARLFYEKEDFLGAENYYAKSLEINPSFASALIELALVYEKQGRIEMSRDTYKKVINLLPHSLESYVSYGNFLFRIGRMVEAKEQFEKAESLSGYQNLDLKFRLGFLYIENKEFRKAIEEFRLILSSNPNNERATYYLALSHIEIGEYDQALRILDSINPDSEFYSESLVQKAFTHEKKKNLVKSLQFAKQAYGHQPNNRIIVNYLGSVYRRLDRSREAIKIYKKFLRSNPNDEAIYYSLGATYYSMEEEEKSINTMKELIKINPSHADALNFIGYTYADMGVNLDEAEDLIKRALKISPNKGYIIDSLGWVYYKKRRYKEATQLLEKAASLQPDDPAIMEHLGDLYKDRGDTLKALEYYKRGVGLFKDPLEREDVKLKMRLQKKVNSLKRNLN